MTQKQLDNQKAHPNTSDNHSSQKLQPWCSLRKLAAAQNAQGVFLLQLAWPASSSPEVVYSSCKAGEGTSRMFQGFVLLAM